MGGPWSVPGSSSMRIGPAPGTAATSAVAIARAVGRSSCDCTELEETIWIGGRSRALTAAAAATGGAVVVPKTSATT